MTLSESAKRSHLKVEAHIHYMKVQSEFEICWCFFCAEQVRAELIAVPNPLANDPAIQGCERFSRERARLASARRERAALEAIKSSTSFPKQVMLKRYLSTEELGINVDDKVCFHLSIHTQRMNCPSQVYIASVRVVEYPDDPSVLGTMILNQDTNPYADERIFSLNSLSVIWCLICKNAVCS